MAGSYLMVTNSDGTFRGSELLENLGDASEAVEEMWDMIEWLTGGDKFKIHCAHIGHLRKRCDHHADTYPTRESFKTFWSE